MDLLQSPFLLGVFQDHHGLTEFFERIGASSQEQTYASSKFKQLNQPLRYFLSGRRYAVQHFVPYFGKDVSLPRPLDPQNLCWYIFFTLLIHILWRICILPRHPEDLPVLVHLTQLTWYHWNKELRSGSLRNIWMASIMLKYITAESRIPRAKG